MEIKATLTITPKKFGKVFIKCSNGRKYLKDYAYLGPAEVISAKILISKDRKGEVWSTLTQIKFRHKDHIYEFNRAKNTKSFPGNKYVRTQADSKKPSEIRFWVNDDGLSKIHINRTKEHIMQLMNAINDYVYDISNELITDLESKFKNLIHI